MKVFKIYCLRHPLSKEIRYVGVTSQKYVSSRLAQHWHTAHKRNGRTRVCSWIKSLPEKPIIEVIETCNENNWAEKERYWISKLRNLTNHKEGGNGVYINRSNESIIRSANAHKKEIVQLTKDGEFVAYWDSVKAATLAHNGKSLSSISNVLKKRSLTAYKFRWFYKEDYINGNYELIHKAPMSCDHLENAYLYDLNWNLIKEFECKFHIAKYLGCYSSTVHYAFKFKRPLLKQYYVLNYKI